MNVLYGDGEKMSQLVLEYEGTIPLTTSIYGIRMEPEKSR
jgi:hypothetical protein